MPVLGAHAGSLTRSLRQSVETLAVTIVLVTALARGAAAQGNVSIGSSSITGCCDTTVGVTVDSADTSVQFDYLVTFDNTTINCVDVTPGSFVSDCLQSFFCDNVAGRVSVALACVTPRTGGGTLSDIKFLATGNGTSDLSFSACQMDEMPCASTTDGSIAVSMFISPTPTNAPPTGAPTATPTPSACGDGVVQPPEQCDDGNLVSGDGCSASCQAERDKLIPGGTARTDCIHEWLTSPPSAPGSSGVPMNRLQCTDGNSACDFGSTSGECTFHVAPCFNIAEPRFSCTATDVAQVELTRPREDRPGDVIDEANRNEVEWALAGLGGTVRGRCRNAGSRRNQLCALSADCDSTPGSGDGVCRGRFVAFQPPLTVADRCTAFAAIRVAAGSTKTLRLKVTPSKDPVTGRKRRGDTDSLRLICKP